MANLQMLPSHRSSKMVLPRLLGENPPLMRLTVNTSSTGAFGQINGDAIQSNANRWFY